MKFGIESNLSDTMRQVTDLGRQVRFAGVRALTRTAKRIEDAERREIKDVFDRPTPFTQTATFVQPATMDNLVAEVGLKDFAGKGTPAAEYLAPQISGGTRKSKRFERALQSVGAMPPDYRAVPGAAARVDAYGNMDRGQIVQILSYFQAFPEAGYKANMTRKRKAALAKGSRKKLGYSYFVGRPGDRLPLGIWQRFNFSQGSAIKPVIIFVPSAVYQAVFDFTYVGEDVIRKHLDAEFKASLEEALRTAR